MRQALENFPFISVHLSARTRLDQIGEVTSRPKFCDGKLSTSLAVRPVPLIVTAQI